MADNKESFQESLMIKRAKRRLLGALSILISLFVLSIFFLQDRTEINSKNSIKISFLEIDTNNYHAEKSYEAQDKLTQDMKSPIIVKKLSNFSRDESIEDRNGVDISVNRPNSRVIFIVKKRVVHELKKILRNH
jgi:hypothetical protein